MRAKESKERITITLDEAILQEVKEVAEEQNRPISNVFQILVRHGLREMRKMRLGPGWSEKLIGAKVIIERNILYHTGRVNTVMDEYEREEEIEEIGSRDFLQSGRVIDVVEWRSEIHAVVEVEELYADGVPVGNETELLVMPLDGIVKVVGSFGNEIFQRPTELKLLGTQTEVSLAVGSDSVAQAAGVSPESKVMEKRKVKGKSK